MTLICALKTSNDFPIVCNNVARFTFKSLHTWLFIHAQDHGVFRWIQIQPHNIRSLWDELLIRTDTPAPLALKTNPLFAQDPPYGMNGGIKVLRERWAIPYRKTIWRRRLQCLQDLIAKLLPIVDRFTWTRSVAKSLCAFFFKTSAPFDNRIRSSVQFPGCLGNALPFQKIPNDPSSLHQPGFFGTAPRQLIHLVSLFITRFNRQSSPGHKAPPFCPGYHISFIYASKH